MYTRLILGGALASALAFAQSSEDLAKMKRAAEEIARSGNFEYKLGVAGTVVKGQPYSAVVVSENTQQLADGNRIHSESSYSIYRDMEGRVRRDQPTGKEYMVSDPVAGVTYLISDPGKVARKLPLAKEVTSGDKKMAELKERLYAVQSGRMEVAGPMEGRVAKVDDLGTKMIEGVNARGTRFTTTIAARSIGNDQPLQIVDETWVATDLKVTVLSQHSDPRSGNSSYRLTRISLATPQASLFEVPAGYQVSDAK